MAGIIPTNSPSPDIIIESEHSSHIDFQNVKTTSDTMKVSYFINIYQEVISFDYLSTEKPKTRI